VKFEKPYEQYEGKFLETVENPRLYYGPSGWSPTYYFILKYDPSYVLKWQNNIAFEMIMFEGDKAVKRTITPGITPKRGATLSNTRIAKKLKLSSDKEKEIVRLIWDK
jgi:hypothetical protein